MDLTIVLIGGFITGCAMGLGITYSWRKDKQRQVLLETFWNGYDLGVKAGRE